jgi:hypothetical protein
VARRGKGVGEEDRLPLRAAAAQVILEDKQPHQQGG